MNMLQDNTLERYIIYRPFTDNIVTIEAIYTGYIPSDLTGGLLITSPDPDKLEYPNLRPVLRMKLDTKELFYDYESDYSLEMRLMGVSSDVNILEQQNGTIIADIGKVSSDITDTQIGLTEAYETTLLVDRSNTDTQLALTEVYEALLETKAALSTANLAIERLQEEITQLKGE